MPPISFPKSGEVWWLNTGADPRWHLILSPNETIRDTTVSHFLACRLTLHKGKPIALGGEWPVLFTDETNADYFPKSFVFHHGLAQGAGIVPVPKELISQKDSTGQALARRTGVAEPELVENTRGQIRSILRGDPVNLPQNRVNKNALLEPFRCGRIVEVRYTIGGSRNTSAEKYLVVSSNSFHDWYPEPAVLLVEVLDPTADIETRYGYFKIYSLNLTRMKMLKVSLKASVVGQISMKEQEEVLALCECALGV
jgi:hypothetical protein